MTKQFMLLVQQFCRDHQLEARFIRSVWCLAHRLNLVTKTFLSAKPMNIVLAFADWFANKRHQVSYKRFLSSGDTSTERKAIQQPSDTRWLYYRDVLGAIMSQEERVESFVSDERDFATFWQGVRRDEEKYGRSVNREFSFKDAYIKSLFGFCSYILELLGNVNILSKNGCALWHSCGMWFCH